MVRIVDLRARSGVYGLLLPGLRRAWIASQLALYRGPDRGVALFGQFAKACNAPGAPVCQPEQMRAKTLGGLVTPENDVLDKRNRVGPKPVQLPGGLEAEIADPFAIVAERFNQRAGAVNPPQDGDQGIVQAAVAPED